MTVATRVLPRREQVRRRGARPAAVVGVHVGQALARPGPAVEDGRDAGPGQGARKRILAVERDEEDAVHVPLPDVALHLLVLALAAGEQQEELELGVGERGRDPLDDREEERVREHAALGLRDDERDRVGAPGDEAARGAVGDVAQPLDRLLDRLPGVGADLGRAVDDAGDGRRRHVGQAGDLLERGRRAPRRGGQIFRASLPLHPRTRCVL